MVTPDMGAIAGKGSESWSPGGPDHGGVARSFNMDMDMNMWSRHANLHSFVSQVGWGGRLLALAPLLERARRVGVLMGLTIVASQYHSTWT